MQHNKRMRVKSMFKEKEMINRNIILLLALLFPLTSISGEFPSKNDTREFSDQITKQILSENFKAAFDKAKLYWRPIPSVEIDGLVNKINLQWPLVKQRFGKVAGMEFIREESIGSSFHRYYYLHKFENHAIYWSVSFYKPNKAWKINSIKYLDDLDRLYK